MHAHTKLLTFLLATVICLLPVSASAYFSPDLEKLTAADINEMLQSKRADSKSDIKRLMEWGYVVKGGDAPSGLRLAKFEEWRPKLYRKKSFWINGDTFELSDYNSVSYWDLGSHELKEVIVCEDDKYSIVGNAPDAPVLVVSKYVEKTGDQSIKVEFYSIDRESFKEKAKLGFMTLYGDKEKFRSYTGLWAVADYAVNAEGSLFMVTSDRGRYIVADTKDGKHWASSPQTYPINEQTDPVNLFSPDGTKFFTTLGDKKRGVFDLKSGDLLAEVPEHYHTPSFSSDGKYLAVGKNLMTADGKKKLFDMKFPTKLFIPGTDYLGTFYLDGIGFELVDKNGLIRVGGQAFKQLAKYQREAIVSRDGNYAFLAFDQNANFVGVSGDGYQFALIQIEKPDEEMIKLITDAERAIELYKAGLTKQGMAMMRKLIEQNPFGLWVKDYDQKVYAAGMPLILDSELLVPLIKKEKELIRETKEQSQGLALLYNAYMLYALAARQPAVALQAYNQLLQGVKDNTIKLTLKLGSFSIIVRTLCLKMMGKDDDAYSYLIDRMSEVDKLAEHALPHMKRYPEIFRPLLLEKQKLAVILDIDPKTIPDPGKELTKQDFLGLDGQVFRGAPPKPAMTGGTAPATSDTQNAGEPKKKESVVLD